MNSKIGIYALLVRNKDPVICELRIGIENSDRTIYFDELVDQSVLCHLTGNLFEGGHESDLNRYVNALNEAGVRFNPGVIEDQLSKIESVYG